MSTSFAYLTSHERAPSAASNSRATARPSPRSRSSAQVTCPSKSIPERSNAGPRRRGAQQLGEYFAGDREDFDLPVRLAGHRRSSAGRLGAARRHWSSAQFISYGELGARLGRAGSGRAIGGAVGANPVPIIIGCHRVLSSSGKITGYSGGDGIPTKLWLLDARGDHAGGMSATDQTPADIRFRGRARPPLVIGDDGLARCSWSASDPEYRRYHDEEWGAPQHDPRALYEKLCLEGFQAGLSWITILRRRPAFREASTASSRSASRR